ncbi:type II toxin-antitoxin system PemK/MazF family toxin [Tardiphaga alba]|uniref:Type II toxin-antitoxin system PemK/MazF family toxin n=1 Tax=Tardiphaga alba TaxID=340268 RepID=A0ABX8A7N0_9BRAD|nr:type II toxin-antitoxin system PemK/MazF family toxin [Tardiphaga alba]QUS39026.1 type II toxin-antitoxin system PemK/MazF family toxin [Tardiphaga alba]
MILPDAGDIAWVDLDDVRGTEQAGRRPALVLTSREFHETSRRAVICPITLKIRNWPTNVVLPAGLEIAGEIMVDQIRSIDRTERMFAIVEKAPAKTLRDVRIKVAVMLGMDFGVLVETPGRPERA